MHTECRGALAEQECVASGAVFCVMQFETLVGISGGVWGRALCVGSVEVCVDMVVGRWEYAEPYQVIVVALIYAGTDRKKVTDRSG